MSNIQLSDLLFALYVFFLSQINLELNSYILKILYNSKKKLNILLFFNKDMVVFHDIILFE